MNVIQLKEKEEIVTFSVHIELICRDNFISGITF